MKSREGNDRPPRFPRRDDVVRMFTGEVFCFAVVGITLMLLSMAYVDR